MPPRFAYWTIIAGGLPTAFRATEQDELMPTFQRLREKHPDAEMKWFSRGKLWESPEAARADRERSRGFAPRPPRTDDAERPREEGAAAAGKPRGKSWRPGGEHRDPRQVFKDAKKDRNIRGRAEKFARKFGDRDRAPREKPHGDTLPVTDAASRPAREDWRDRPREERGAGERPLPTGDWKNRPPRERPHGDPIARTEGSSYRDRPKTGGFDKRGSVPFRRDDKRDNQGDSRGDFRSRPNTPTGDRPQGKSEWRDRGPKPEWRDRGAKPEWRDRAPRERPHGDPLARSGGAPDRDRPKPGGFEPRGKAPFRRDDSRGDSRGDRGGGRGPDSRPESRPDTRPDYRSRPATPGGRPPGNSDWRDRGPKPEWRDRPPRERPHGDALARSSGAPDRDRPKTGSFDKRGSVPFRRDDHRGESRGDDRSRPAAPRGDRPPGKGDWRDRSAKPEGRDRAPRPEWRDRPAKPEWRDRPPREGDSRARPPRETPHGDPMRDNRARPAGRPDGDRDRDARNRAPGSDWRDRPQRESSWKDRPPREKPHGDPLNRGGGRPPQRPFEPKRFGRNQGTDDPTPRSPRPEPDREPRRGDNPPATPPPRPGQPGERPAGPPERGRLVKKKRS